LLLIAFWMSLFVAATMRMSTLISFFPPYRRI